MAAALPGSKADEDMKAEIEKLRTENARLRSELSYSTTGGSDISGSILRALQNMILVPTINKDWNGMPRLACKEKKCSCSMYAWNSDEESFECHHCGHLPGQHVAGSMPAEVWFYASKLDGIPGGVGAYHSAILVGDIFYEYGKDYGLRRVQGEPANWNDKQLLGLTRKSNLNIESRIDTWSEGVFRKEKYDVLSHNCHVFANQLAYFLLGTGIPKWVFNVQDSLKQNPALCSSIRMLLSSFSSMGSRSTGSSSSRSTKSWKSF